MRPWWTKQRWYCIHTPTVPLGKIEWILPFCHLRSTLESNAAIQGGSKLLLSAPAATVVATVVAPISSILYALLGNGVRRKKLTKMIACRCLFLKLGLRVALQSYPSAL